MARSVADAIFIAAVPSLLVLLAFCIARSSAAAPVPACLPPHDTFPFCDASLPRAARVADLVARIRAADKPGLLSARGVPRGNETALPYLGVPAYDYGGACLHGIQSTCGTQCPTVFPHGIGLAASWNASAWDAIGRAQALELRALWLQGVTEPSSWSGRPSIGLDCWSPTINILVDARWGRAMETAGEDPFLTAAYGAAMTRGLQEGPRSGPWADARYAYASVAIKHWDAYVFEGGDGFNFTRHDFDARVSEFDLLDTYTPAFATVLREASPKGVMCSYNAVNGVPSCTSASLNTLLRDTFNASSVYITSDTGAIADAYDADPDFKGHTYAGSGSNAACLAMRDGGVDMDSGVVYWRYLLNATSPVPDDDTSPPPAHPCTLSMARIDEALHRVLRPRFDLGLFDPIAQQPLWHVPPDVVAAPPAQALSLQAARESIVLLNNPQGMLPLNVTARPLHIAVVGPHANATGALLGNYVGQVCRSGFQKYDCVQTPFAAIEAVNGAAGGVTTMAVGCTVAGNETVGIPAAVAAARDADVVVLGVGLSLEVEAEGQDRHSLLLPGVQQQLVDAVLAVGKPTVAFLVHGGAVDYSPLVDRDVAVIDALVPGPHGARAIADVLTGAYNPGGAMPYTAFFQNFTQQLAVGDMAVSTGTGRTYRYWSGGPVLAPFGFGGSYTTFHVRWHRGGCGGSGARGDVVRVGMAYNWTVNVSNTGAVAGDTVVQAYYVPGVECGGGAAAGSSSRGGVRLPLVRELFGFARVHLLPRETTTLTFTFVAVSDTRTPKRVRAGPAGAVQSSDVRVRCAGAATLAVVPSGAMRSRYGSGGADGDGGGWFERSLAAVAQVSVQQ